MNLDDLIDKYKLSFNKTYELEIVIIILVPVERMKEFLTERRVKGFMSKTKKKLLKEFSYK